MKHEEAHNSTFDVALSSIERYKNIEGSQSNLLAPSLLLLWQLQLKHAKRANNLLLSNPLLKSESSQLEMS